MRALYRISTMQMLCSVLESVDVISLYGAGYYLNEFLYEIDKVHEDYLKKIVRIWVSNGCGNSLYVRGIPVIEFDSDKLSDGDIIFLTLGNRYTKEVCSQFEDLEVTVYELDFNMFQKIPYNEIKSKIQPFIDEFPFNVSKLNMPEDGDNDIIAWTCWWQGPNAAPELVQACLQSQRKYLPPMVRRIVITKDNYSQYITIPEYILQKVESGKITYATLSDIIRSILLYRYGGFWMDATLLLTEPLRSDIFAYPIYTRNLPEVQFCTNTMWAGWFFYSQKGYKLFQFVMEAFFYYYLNYDSIQYYLTVDYFIAIACNSFPDIERDMRSIPYNNERAQELGKHLTEVFEKKSYAQYIKDGFVQKLTYKIDWNGMNPAGTIYDFIIKENRE